MDLTDGEKAKIYDWAMTYHSSASMFQKQGKSSFFKAVNEREAAITAYDLEKFPDIRKALQELWMDEDVMQEIVRVCAVAMLKQRPSEVKIESDGTSSNDDSKIPPFVYVF